MSKFARLVVLAVLVSAAACGGDDRLPTPDEVAAGAETVPQPAPPTTEVQPTTTAAPIPTPDEAALAESSETCSNPEFNFTFETIAPYTCDDIYKTTVAILLANGWDNAPPQTGVFLEAGGLCTMTTEATFLPESTYLPALGDALMGVMCDADRSLLVPA